MSCQTSRKTIGNLPNIDFPEFPIDVSNPRIVITKSGENNVKIYYADKDETVIIPVWFWLELVEYDVKVNEAYLKYQVLRDKYNVSIPEL